ncbi:DUF2971 domain-containing protein [Pseudomonas sp. TNT2022 ID642]|uniref:DUF2971 domain-containing protein n=1 Tax=Pseudomonas sp. TNT2022 ID642 TaxID=2942632 RepID=UPI002361FD0B|nr:DUF2971 domain-containing protein [Pseudomonas sp. TNT2022 ID642]MDD1001863.1 DUF2971 domain-containing protein [Pseudomonas sp. TNT2022 ID642]
MPATLVDDLTGKETIWRYMTLDRLINILDDKALFMTGLSSYSESDPYEGYPPPAVLKQVKKHCPPAMYLSHDASKAQDLNNLKVFAQRIFHSRVVSCWYQGDEESEAMWKIYGDTGKAIAIRTTVEKLAKALGNEFHGKIARVVYVNYAKTTREDYEVVMTAHAENVLLDPIYKRHSYAHEREVRAYTQIKDAKIDDPSTYKSYLAPIDCASMIDEIIVSPFCGDAYVKATNAVATLFGFENKVRQSTLISDLTPIYSALESNI